MTKKAQPPWASGPGEILRHGLDLLKQDTDTKRRLAMISIDNAVELMMKTFLGLPKRISGLTISRREYQEFSESFPKLLDALEKYAADKLDGINTGEIEWYHRLRNQLYHQGNGLTVERDKVEIYAELANLLFANLFGFRLIRHEDDGVELLGSFMAAWAEFEKVLTSKTHLYYATVTGRPMLPIDAARVLAKEVLISRSDLAEIDQLRMIRNDVVHGAANHKEILTPELIDKLRKLTRKIEESKPSISQHDDRFKMVIQDYEKRSTPKYMIDTFLDLSDEEKADLYDRAIIWKKGRKAKENPYRK